MLLDLKSSWVSHRPPEGALTEVIGQDMDAEELKANGLLNRNFVQDLNRNPILPLESDSCDAVLCCVGVQYLQRSSEICAGYGVYCSRARPLSSASPTAAFRPKLCRSGGRSVTVDMLPLCVSISSAPSAT